MEANEFGMWGLGVLVWIFAIYVMIWGRHFVRNEQEKYWLEQQLRLRLLEQIDREELELELNE